MGTRENRPGSAGLRGRARRQGLILLLLLITTVIGLASKFYTGPGANWVNNSLSGVFYEIFWCLAVLLFFLRARPWKIASTVFLVTCLLEFLQLWDEVHFRIVRGTFLGSALLGTSFTWLDFPYYIVGCGIGWLLIRGIRNDLNHTAVP